MKLSSPSIGRLAPRATGGTLIDRTIQFVWESLVPWRNDPEREHAEAEEELNGQLQNFLQARAMEEFSMVLFQNEERQTGRRRVDLAAKPVRPIAIEGVTYNKYHPILVMEGKRLPPPSKAREQEYVTGGDELSGGIQRFKLGLHGAAHGTAILLGYLQSGDAVQWHSRINGWIRDLAASSPSAWSENEKLAELSTNSGGLSARCQSVHPRIGSRKISPIRILHFWIDCQTAESPAPPAPAAELIARIKTGWQINMTELAEILGVTRPTVYGWLNGKTLSDPKSLRKLQALATAAADWEQATAGANWDFLLDYSGPKADEVTIRQTLGRPDVSTNEIRDLIHSRMDQYREAYSRSREILGEPAPLMGEPLPESTRKLNKLWAENAQKLHRARKSSPDG